MDRPRTNKDHEIYQMVTKIGEILVYPFISARNPSTAAIS